MKKIATILVLTLSCMAGYAQTAAGGPTVNSALVPQYCQGVTPTNNNRVPIWYWAEISGLTPGATYRYYTTMDSLNASPTSNGAGVPMLINAISGTIRRTTNPGLTNSAGHDSLVVGNGGTYAGWFGVDASGNGRYVPGATLYPLIVMNNGTPGSTTVAYRILLTAYPVTVINFGTTAAATEGTALYDSLNSAPKNFNCLYDNVTATGRPISIAITEDDGCDLFSITSTAAFYRNNVDTMAMRWGTIIPNTLANGIRAIEERAFTGGMPVDTVTDSDGWWCSGVNTANMTGGNAGTYLNSTFSLSSSASIPDTVWVNLSANFNATTNDTAATITWDFGDTSSTATGASVTHTYLSSGIYSVTVVISNGGCSDTIWQNIVVMLGTSTPRIIQLGYTIAPNPSEGLFNITATSAIEKEIEVYDVLGNLVYTQTFSGTTTFADLSAFDKGVYFMRITENVQGGKTATKRIVLQ
jgi:PKD repeat protein